jgi:small GTP-binding protein
MEYSTKESLNSVAGSRIVELPKVKVVVVGVSGVGKTSISQRFVNNEYNSRSPATLGASFIERVYEHPPGHSYRLQIWDTAGQEKYRAIAKIYYKDARVAILVYDVADELSFSCMKEWAEDVLNNSSNKVLLAVVGNKTDLLDDPSFDPKKEVSYKAAKEYAQSIKAIFHTTSAKDNKGINELF